MGQYFRAVNETKREYVDPWDIGGLAKLFEWCANRQAGIFAYLLRKSNETGGGDIDDPMTAQFAGRWAGDKICLVGDYDGSRLYQVASKEFLNISKKLAREYNRFIGIDQLKLNKGC